MEEILANEAVENVTEEIVESNPVMGVIGKILGVGIIVGVGTIVYKKVIKPLIKKIKDKKEARENEEFEKSMEIARKIANEPDED